MSSWHPVDLVSDRDLLDYERNLHAVFGDTTDWASQRTKALEDWLFPTLKGQGLEPQRLRTRFVPSEVYSYTASAFIDRTTAASNLAATDLDLAAIFATAANDRLYVGSTEPFRGLFVRIHDNASSVAGTLTAKYWNGQWKALSIADGTAVSGKTLGAGGSVTWTLPVDWATRPVNGSGLRYWAQLAVSATPTGAQAAQIATIRRSALCAPATLRTLALIYREAPVSQEGPWREKAEYYESEADAALQRALTIVGGEFDTVTDDDLIDAEEAAQTLEAAGGGWRLERG
jgi:hypothetical protein